MRMKVILLLLSLVSTVLAQYQPPSIQSTLQKQTLYAGTVVLPCVATGLPTPTYTWYVNGQNVNTNDNNIQPAGGNLTIVTNGESRYEGFYQCHASNGRGTSISDVTWLRLLRLPVESIAKTMITAMVGQNFTIPCTLAQGQVVPSASYRWQTVADSTDNNPSNIVLDQRLQIDDRGTLTFASVVADDSQNGRYYRCHLTNAAANNMETSIAYTLLNVNSQNPVKPTQMTTLFSYSWPSIALERTSVSLRCFFGGASNIQVTWKKPDGSAPSGNRYLIGPSTLTINSVQKSDEGTYTCTGTSNPLPTATSTINLIVQSAPIFLSPNDGPHDINVTTGDTVVINCNAYANPNATAIWYLNGQPLTSNNLNPKFTLSSDMKTLTISNVCKSCPSGTMSQSDLMVIQCNASNSNGYAFADGYINVLDPTVIKQISPTEQTIQPPDTAIFNCSAVSDPTTPITYTWTLDNKPVYDGSVNTSIPGMLYIDTSGKGKYTGTWTCNATNGVSSVQSTAELNPPGGTKMGGVEWWWWILLLILLLLLLAFVLVVLICCRIYKNRGEAYPVDEEERKGGIDPVKELHEIGFHDFQRPVDAPDGVMLQTPAERAKYYGGTGSINSSLGKASDDEMSLDNYANVNQGKFSEDGSFIGQYNPNRMKLQLHPGIPESAA